MSINPITRFKFNTVSDAVIVSVIDGTDPTLTSPIDISYDEGSTGNEIIWTANDLNPTTYSITNNTVEFDSGNWIDGQTFTLDVDGLSYGTYTFNITVVDIDGNTVSDTVIVSVIDGTITTLTSPADITYNEGSTGNEIIWTANDFNPTSYSITNNSIEFESGNWIDGQVFTIDIDGLAIGEYTYVITIYDIDGNTVSDTVIVSVKDDTFADDTEKDSTVKDSLTRLVIIGVGGFVGLIGITMMVLIKRRR
ncbi:hypothetical protein ES708_33783 [subsurface metagenome]